MIKVFITWPKLSPHDQSFQNSVKVVKTWSKLSKYKRNTLLEGKDAKESTLSPAMSPMVTDYILCSSIKDTGSLIFLAFAFIIVPLIGLFLHAMVPCPSARPGML